MNIPIYQVDAFTAVRFAGNPAAVCMLDAWLNDAQLQAVAAENNQSETAFLVRSGHGFELRWFTPVTEVALCGHATLASAHVLFTCRGWPADTVAFETRRSGTLTVTRRADRLEMDFPATPVTRLPPPDGLAHALGNRLENVFTAGEDLMVVMADEDDVRAVQPDMAALSAFAHRGTIVTAKGRSVDFVSRFFAPRVGIPEDPVTGSAHCALTSYWSRVLGKPDLHARQLSTRGGELFCRAAGDRVHIAGQAVLYLEGTITV